MFGSCSRPRLEGDNQIPVGWWLYVHCTSQYFQGHHYPLWGNPIKKPMSWNDKGFLNIAQLFVIYIVELRTPAMPVGVGGGKGGGGCHLNMRTWHAEGRRPILGLCWPSLGLCWPILRPWWPMPMRTKCCNLQHSALWDGKNPCKYQSCSPRKWLKHSYLQSFVHITIFVFLKNV